MTQPSGDPGSEPGPVAATELLPTPPPRSAASTGLLAIALAVACLACGVLVDSLGGGAAVTGLVTAVVVALIVVAGGSLDRRSRARIAERDVAALVEHLRGGPEPRGDDPVLRASVALVAEAKRAVAARSELADAADERARQVEAERTALVRTLRRQVADPLDQLTRDDDAEVAAVATALSAALTDAIVSAAVDGDAVELGDEIVVAELLIAALDPVGTLLLGDVAMVVDGDEEAIGSVVLADVVRLAAAIRTVAWAVTATRADTLTVTVSTTGSGIRVELAPVDVTELGPFVVDGVTSVIAAHGGTVETDALAVRIDLPTVVSAAAPESEDSGTPIAAAHDDEGDLAVEPVDGPGGSDQHLVDVVDERDRVIDTVTRAEIRDGGLRHRAVYVVIRTSGDGIVVHRRADWKDVYPGAWDCCFGGVLDAGEAWSASARRELAEEAGIETDLSLLGDGRYDDDETGIVGRVYVGRHDGPYPCPDGEVVETRIVPRSEVAAFLDAHDHCPDSAVLVLPLLDDLLAIE